MLCTWFLLHVCYWSKTGFRFANSVLPTKSNFMHFLDRCILEASFEQIFIWQIAYFDQTVTLLFCRKIMRKNRFWFLRCQTHGFAAMKQTLELLNTNLSIRSPFWVSINWRNTISNEAPDCVPSVQPKETASLRTSLETTEWCQIPLHCVESARIRGYSGSYFRAFWMNTERYSVSLPIQSEFGKIRTRIAPKTDTFYTALQISSSCCKTTGRRRTTLCNGNHRLCEVLRSGHGKQQSIKSTLISTDSLYTSIQLVNWFLVITTGYNGCKNIAKRKAGCSVRPFLYKR